MNHKGFSPIGWPGPKPAAQTDPTEALRTEIEHWKDQYWLVEACLESRDRNISDMLALHKTMRDQNAQLRQRVLELELELRIERRPDASPSWSFLPPGLE